MNLQTPIKNAGGIYTLYASRLEKLGIVTFEDLLFYFPFRYDDFSLISKIAVLQAGETVTIQGTVTLIKNDYTKNGKRLQKAKISDGTGEIDIIWFNQPYITKTIHEGDTISLSGKVDFGISHKLIIQSPDFEIIPASGITLHTGRLVPIYSETKGLSSKWLRRQVFRLLEEHKDTLIEYLPDSVKKKDNFIDYKTAIEQIHFPNNLEYAKQARDRLAFDELFLLQMASIKRRTEWKEEVQGNKFEIAKYQKDIDRFWNSLPFTLTNAQQRALHDIFQDIGNKKPMNRLLEGDVGSGKTVVGAIAMYVAFLNGFQSVLMAPTEILAEQHYKTISDLLSPLGVKVEIVTGSKKLNAKRPLRQRENEASYTLNAFDILIGTHAVLSEKITFKNLGLVIIDEQQRFGVEQRGIIRGKGANPHLLTMTATPIPRTVALTLYGDLDVSYLDEMPKGRKFVKTWLVPSEKRNSGYLWIEEQLKTIKGQAFIICPFIEESESMTTIKAATKEYERLKTSVFKNLKLGLLHGKMKAKEKEMVLEDFRQKKFDILVATPVVEVGIDIPNATIIVIEAAERFGLAGLHQLRGRVGRGEKQSYCLLFTDSTNAQTQTRLKAMETMYVGAELAELDLKIRGGGNIFGTEQHGRRMLKVANFSDFTLIEKAKREATAVFPHISDYAALGEKIASITTKIVSPD